MKIQRFLQQRAISVIAGLLAVGLIISLIDGENQHLPPTALGSTILLHIERAAVFLAAIYLLYVLAIYTTAGAIPHQVGGIEFQQLQEMEEEATLEKANEKVEILAKTLEEQQAITNKLLEMLQPDIDNRQDTTTIGKYDE